MCNFDKNKTHKKCVFYFNTNEPKGYFTEIRLRNLMTMKRITSATMTATTMIMIVAGFIGSCLFIL